LEAKRHIVPFPALGTSETGGVFAQLTSLSEAQTLYVVRRFLSKRVPVPEVYAFVDDDDLLSFLYMKLVQGVTICECWADLSDETKMDVCAQLKPMMHALRELEREPSDSFIGKCVFLKISIAS
jgi:aminoglycoside phosphotransferase